jgi:hypothetical protein
MHFSIYRIFAMCLKYVQYWILSDEYIAVKPILGQYYINLKENTNKNSVFVLYLYFEYNMNLIWIWYETFEPGNENEGR